MRNAWRFLALVMIILLSSYWIERRGWAYDLHDNANTHIQQGNTAMAWQHYPQAMAHFSNALQLAQPSEHSIRAAAYHNLGQCYMAMNDARQASICYMRAIQEQGAHLFYFQRLVTAWRRAGLLKTSQLGLNQAISINPADAKAFLLLGLIAHSQRQLPLAQQYFERYLMLEPNALLAQDLRQAFLLNKRPSPIALEPCQGDDCGSGPQQSVGESAPGTLAAP